MPAPQAVLDLVERFARNREAYKSPSYNETQLRREFLDPFFEALGWDVNNRQGYWKRFARLAGKGLKSPLAPLCQRGECQKRHNGKAEVDPIWDDERTACKYTPYMVTIMCMEVMIMGARTNIVLDEELVEEVKTLTSLKTKKEVVDLALHELLKQLRRKKLLAMRHKGLWEGDLTVSRRQRFDTD